MKKLAHGEKDRARIEHDVACVSRVHNSRKSKCIPSLSNKFSVFCTPNNQLIKSVNGQFSDEIKKNSVISVR